MAAASLCSALSLASCPPNHHPPAPSHVSFAAFSAPLKSLLLDTPALSSHKSLRRVVVRAVEEEDVLASKKQKGKVLLKAPKKQQLVLKFVWMEKNIGLGLDQVVAGHGTLPLSPYYFWPRKDAWEELKTQLERKKWISKKQAILLLNQATDIINLWQQNTSL